MRLLNDYFGKQKLNAIKPLAVERYLNFLIGEGRSASYIAKCRGMLFQIMKKAEANDLIRRNPVASAETVRTDSGTSSKDAFTMDEIRRLMTGMPNDRMGMSIRLMLGTGMRTQEIMALQPEHIEPDGSVIHIRQAVNMVKGTPQIGPPKTKTSVRDIPVPKSLQSVAAEFRKTSQPFIWHGDKVPICNPSVFRKQFREMLESIEGVRILSPHCCRHTYVSQLQACGVEIETIKNLSGHAEINMTEHYLHVQQEVKLSAAAKLNSLFPAESSAQ